MARTVTKSTVAVAYPLVPANTPDFEQWARAWCERKGWALVEVVSQRRMSDAWYQLTVRWTKP
jgi:hypothetical protein